MSVRMPDIRLDNGLFMYEEGIPVFIDANGTRHYEIGKAQEQLFISGMQLQKTLDASSLDEKDRRMTVLKGEIARVTQAAKNNFTLGQKLQAAKDKASIEKVRIEAYREGRFYRMEEERLKIDSAFQRGVSHNANQTRELVVSLTSENIHLRREVDHLGRCLATAHKVSGLNLSPRSSRREFVASTSLKFEKEDPLPLPEQGEDAPLAVVEQNPLNVVDDDSETKL